jgi:hypothetical protein
MPPRKNGSRRSGEPAANTVSKEEKSIDFLHILPFVLDSVQVHSDPTLPLTEEPILPVEARHNLRLTCKAAKAVVDPYLPTIIMRNTSIWDDTELTKAFSGSPLTLAARHLTTDEFSLTRDTFIKFNRIQFKNLQSAELRVCSHACDLIPNWSARSKQLKALDLSIYWHYDLHPRLKFTSYSKAKANWSLLESLSLEIEPDRSDFSDSDDEDEEQEPPCGDYGEAVCLLNYFPNLKQLRFGTRIKIEDLRALVAVQNVNKLESVDLTFSDIDGEFLKAANVLADAKWPKLHGLTINEPGHLCKTEMFQLLKVPWILQLKKLVLMQCSMCLGAATELTEGLQLGGDGGGRGVLEYLRIDSCSAAIFLAFKDANFPRLKKVDFALERPAEAEDPRRQAMNRGLSDFFSTTTLPCLESIAISQSIYSLGYHMDIELWSDVPECAKNFSAANAFSIFPLLNYIDISGIRIEKECAEFLSIFYKRGCRINLQCADVHSGLDLIKLNMMLVAFGLTKAQFDEELNTLGLYIKVYWYNLLSMEELKAIAAAVFLKAYTHQMKYYLKPAKAAMEISLGGMGGRGVLLQKRLKDASEATQELARALSKGENDGASGSGGGGRRRRAP